MAHVKCIYDHYSCSFGTGDCGKCGFAPDDSLEPCCHLQCDPGYYEKTSKNIDYDGKFLTVGKFYAVAGDYELRTEPEDNVIDYLEIDGIVYYGEKEKAGQE